MMDISLKLNQPLHIGGKTIDKRLVLAPMAGLTHIAFRQLVESYGGYGLQFTEMCNARAIPHENRHVSPVFRWRDSELPRLVCQIFGSEPACMAEAARRIEDEGFFGVDLNFGCSVSAVCKRNSGAALLKSPEQALAIVKAVRRAVRFPLFIKFRTGWQDRPEPAVAMARAFAEAGADALTFHPRVAPDRRSRPPKWEYIGRVKDAVSIPVFGNGNVFTAHDCRKMMTQTGCDGVSLGRIAVARPWVFAKWSDGWLPGPDIYRENALMLIDLLERHYEEVSALRKFKKTAPYLCAMFRYGHGLHKQLAHARSLSELRLTVLRLLDMPPETGTGPNLNLFA